MQNKREFTTLAIRLGERAQTLDVLFQNGQIGKERYMTERNAIDVVVSYIADDIGYSPRDYKHYSDIICAQEVKRRVAETEQRLKTAAENKAKADAEAKRLFEAFMAGVNCAV